MAVTFSDLHTESGIRALDAFLSGKSYIYGGQLTKDDVKLYASVQKPSADLYPNASKWYEAVAAKLATSFPGKAVGVQIGGQAPLTAVEAQEVFGLLLAAMEVLWFYIDIFQFRLPRYCRRRLPMMMMILIYLATRQRRKKKAAEAREAAKAPAKKKESGKSSVLIDIKPWDDETDMKKLEECVRSIEMPGLLWGASKLVAVGYGIKKLQIMLTIVDDLVSVDTMIGSSSP
ncbi:elongation factor 1-beta 2-like isoform X1 [Salvia divinorum]|uniref:Elongation factor 1-beta 2-like isoform X1 n=1 Tax=Salvia divinorum TaxID=28513 RepID=A0ABD1GIQ7_SALDI